MSPPGASLKCFLWRRLQARPSGLWSGRAEELMGNIPVLSRARAAANKNQDPCLLSSPSCLCPPNWPWGDGGL